MHIKNHFKLRFFALPLFLTVMVQFSVVIAVPVALLLPPCRTLTPGTAELRTWQPPCVIQVDAQRMLDLMHGDVVTKVDSVRIVAVCAAEVDRALKEERYRYLRSLFVRYVEYAHLFGDDGLAPAISEHSGWIVSEDMSEDDDVCFVREDASQVCQIDGSTVINQAVQGVLRRHSFETLEGVSVAIKELEKNIQIDLKRYGVETHAQLVLDLHKLNSEQLSASYCCMKQVAHILSQLPQESSQAIRDQFPWYLRSMV